MESKIIYNKIIPIRGYSAINLFGIIFARRRLSSFAINHENIHTAQMLELLILPFYIWYILEWLIKMIKYGKESYYHISFEKEAYINQESLTYLNKRKHYNWIRYVI